MYKGYAIFIGGLLAIMIMINAKLIEVIGNGPALMIIHIAGLIGCTLILCLRREKINLRSNLPFYFYIAGALGVVMVIINSITFSKIGASLTIATTVIGQIFISTILDHYGLLRVKVNKFNKKKIIGFIFILIGLLIMTVFS